jgi:hypothetical protein
MLSPKSHRGHRAGHGPAHDGGGERARLRSCCPLQNVADLLRRPLGAAARGRNAHPGQFGRNSRERCGAAGLDFLDDRADRRGVAIGLGLYRLDAEAAEPVHIGIAELVASVRALDELRFGAKLLRDLAAAAIA